MKIQYDNETDTIYVKLSNDKIIESQEIKKDVKAIIKSELVIELEEKKEELSTLESKIKELKKALKF